MKLSIKKNDEAKFLLKKDLNLFSILIDIHMQSFNKDELSIILGKELVSDFYKAIIFSDQGNISLFFFESRLMGFFVYFKNYSKFKMNFSINNLLRPSLVFKLLRNFSKIISHFVVIFSQAKIPKNIYDNYLGAIAIRSENSARLEVFKTLMKHYDEIVHKFYGNNCWGSCREDNKAANLLLQKCGLKLKSQHGWNPKVLFYVSENFEVK